MPRVIRLLLVGLLAAVGLSLPVAAHAAGPLTITTTNLAAARVGVPYATNLKATGGNYARVWSVVAGALPAGLKLSAQGRITGTPTVVGSTAFTVSVHDTSRPRQTATKALVIAVQPLQVTTTSLPDAHDGKAYVAQLTAVGGTKPYTWSIVAGGLSSGVPAFTLSPSGRITGKQAFFSGPMTFTVQVRDKVGRTATRALSIGLQWMRIITPSLPPATRGVAYRAAVKHLDGCATPRWRTLNVNGSGPGIPQAPDIPPGLKIAVGTGVISGVPTVSGTYSFRVIAECNPTSQLLPHTYQDYVLTVG